MYKILSSRAGVAGSNFRDNIKLAWYLWTERFDLAISTVHSWPI